MSFEVEQNVQIPPRNYGGGAGSTKYPWPEMEHGSSFLVECTVDEAEKTYRSVVNSGKEWVKRHKPNMKIVGRREFADEDQQELVGYRFWMIDPEQS